MIAIQTRGSRDPVTWLVGLCSPDAVHPAFGPVHWVDDACVARHAAAGVDLPVLLRERFGLVRLAASASMPGRALYGWAGEYTPITDDRSADRGR